MSLRAKCWSEATENFNKDVCGAWLTRIEKTYAQDVRAYHNLDSLNDKLELYEEIKNELTNPKAVLLAIFFQNLECDPKSGDNEIKSLEQFTEFAEEAKSGNQSIKLLEETKELLTSALTNSTEALTDEGVCGKEDIHYLLDLDIAILGSTPEKYAEYREKIRGEYFFLNEMSYKALRSKVLQNFLQIPNIFATKVFRDRFEKQARANIQSEIGNLPQIPK